jgi:preprotein translocase subunit SecE
MKKIKTIWNNSNVLLKSVFVITAVVALSCLFLFILLVTL